MDMLQAIILGIVEGVTEFLPVSSTGHLTIVEKLMGLQIDDPGVTAFTAIIQLGAILSVLVYFWSDILGLATAWFRGLANAEHRKVFEYRMGWYVIVGSIPVGLVGFVTKDLVAGVFRSLWVVAASLILWSAVMFMAEKTSTRERGEKDLTMKDAVVIGLVQCISLIPGISRSGATISAGLFRGLDRVTATRLSFFLSIPALVAAGIFEAVGEFGAVSESVGWTPTLVSTVVSFIVAYASIAWLLKFVAHHPISVFITYRVGLGLALCVMLAAGVISAT